MHSPTDKAAMGLYLQLMEEIKTRLEIINIAHRNTERLAPGFVREICYLQFRSVCELIALGCLIAHGHGRLPKKLQGTYEADKIIKALEDLNPHFYPQPIRIVVNAEGKTIESVSDSDHLTKADLVELWGRSGAELHRTPLKKVISPPNRQHADFSDVFRWGGKLTALLSCHWLTLKQNERGLLVYLKTEDTGKAEASILDFSVPAGTMTVSSFKYVEPPRR